MSRKNLQEERRIQILQALEKCLIKKPFHETSIKDIAEAAKVNHGSLHYYFTSKEDILLNFIEYIITQYKNDFLRFMDQNNNEGKELLIEGMRFGIQKITLNKNLSRLFIEIWSIANYNKKVRLKLQMMYSEWIHTVSQVIYRTVNNQEEAELTSKALISFFEGTSLLSALLDSKLYNGEEILGSFQELAIGVINSVYKE